MKKHLERLRRNFEKARIALQTAIATEQQTCTHTNLEECIYLPQHIGALPPMRVCCDCGLSEEGWGPGYVVLKGEAHSISRDVLYRKRQGFVICDEHKGPLLRNEATVAQLIGQDEN